MEKEHDTETPFDSHNVKGTSPLREWLYVTAMEVCELPDRKEDRTKQRIGWRLRDFHDCESAKAAKLCEEEVIGLRLYTGPAFEKCDARGTRPPCADMLHVRRMRRR